MNRVRVTRSNRAKGGMIIVDKEMLSIALRKPHFTGGSVSLVDKDTGDIVDRLVFKPLRDIPHQGCRGCACVTTLRSEYCRKVDCWGRPGRGRLDALVPVAVSTLSELLEEL